MNDESFSSVQGGVKKLITESKNICIIPSPEPEALSAALALFYTLKEMGKNVNLIAQNYPERLNFLAPSLDFISTPQNLVISVPRNAASISQIYYEKTDNDLKIHLTLESGVLKKEDILLYYTETKPELVITIGIQDFQKQLQEKMDSFGYLLGCAILNIDNNLTNLKFGQHNLIEEKSLSEIVMEITNGNPINKNIANSLLAGITMHYENFKSPKTNSKIFKISSDLMESGADYQKILEMSL